MSKTFGAAAALAFSFTAMFAASAQAQQVGKYEGTTLDGDGISFTVGMDQDTGLLAIQEAGIGFTAPCNGVGAGYTLSTGWGFGLQEDITNGKVKFVIAADYFNFAVNMKFTDSTHITGTIDSRSPSLVPSILKPKKAAFCESPTQSMSLTYTGSAVKAPPLAPGEVVFHQVKK